MTKVTQHMETCKKPCTAGLLLAMGRDFDLLLASCVQQVAFKYLFL